MSKSMRNKIITALVLLALIIPPAILGGRFALAVVLVVSLLAAYEINSIFNEKVNWIDVILTFIFGALMIVAKEKYLLICVVVWIVVLYLMYLTNPNKHKDFVAYTYILSMMVNLAMRTVILFYARNNSLGFEVMVYIGIVSWGCDAAAYFCGRFFGKKKLAPLVSPNKTWEGAIGGFIIGSLVSLLFGYIFLKEYPFILILSGSLLLPIVSQIGDLAFSSIKRKFEIKDFGSIFPGHGGILDRTDSFIFALLCFQCLLLVW